MVNEICPVTGPAAVGLNRTAQIPACPLCRVRVHPYSRMKLLKGVIEKFVIVSNVVPVFVMVISVTPVSMPTTTLLKVMELGLMLNDCAAAGRATNVMNRQTARNKPLPHLNID